MLPAHVLYKLLLCSYFTLNDLSMLLNKLPHRVKKPKKIITRWEGKENYDSV